LTPSLKLFSFTNSNTYTNSNALIVIVILIVNYTYAYQYVIMGFKNGGILFCYIEYKISKHLFKPAIIAISMVIIIMIIKCDAMTLTETHTI